MNVKLKGRRIVIFGENESGKTTLVRNEILPNIKKHIVFDIMGDFNQFNTFECQSFNKGNTPEKDKKSFSHEELNVMFNTFMDLIILKDDNFKKLDLIVVDEFNQLSPNMKPLGRGVKHMSDRSGNNHMGIGTLVIARRPEQINTEFMELANIIISFGLYGKNSRDSFNRRHEGLGDRIASLKFHEYIIYDNRTGIIWGTFKSKESGIKPSKSEP